MLKKLQTKVLFDLLDSMKRLLEKKQHDYATDNDRLSNFKFSGMVLDWAIKSGMTDGAHLAFLSLITTKLARIIELVGAGKEAKNESIRDTLIDLANYAILWCTHIVCPLILTITPKQPSPLVAAAMEQGTKLSPEEAAQYADKIEEWLFDELRPVETGIILPNDLCPVEVEIIHPDDTVIQVEDEIVKLPISLSTTLLTPIYGERDEWISIDKPHQCPKNFILLIDEELFKVVSGPHPDVCVIRVWRGFAGTIPTAHNKGATVYYLGLAPGLYTDAGWEFEYIGPFKSKSGFPKHCATECEYNMRNTCQCQHTLCVFYTEAGCAYKEREG